MILDLAFDFGKVAHQGAYFSTFTPSSLAYYFQQPVIPTISRYHLVGACPHLLPILIKIDVLHIVHQYMTHFSSRNTVIDICLPFHDPLHHRQYLGRYIIWKGKLVAIRLCTTASKLFDGWPRVKTKRCGFRIDKRQMPDILVGQFSLNFRNFRVGLLFQSELLTICNQYINCCFDAVLLVGLDWNIDARKQAKKLQLSMRVLLIEAKPVGRFGGIDIIHLSELIENGKICQIAKHIILDYYEFDRIFVNKRRLPIHKKTISALVAVELPLFLGQTQQNQNIQGKIGTYSIISTQFVFQLPRSQLTQRMQGYLGRLINFLQFNEGAKLVLLIQENPNSICLLFIVKKLLQLRHYDPNKLDLIFIPIFFGSKQLQYFLERIDVINQQSLQKIQCKGGNSLESCLLNKLDSIAIEHSKQEWFAIISTNSTLKNVIELINKRSQPIDTDKNHVITLQTWISLQFLSFQQLVGLYSSNQVREFVGNDDYWKQIWQKARQPELEVHRSIPNAIDQLIDKYLTRTEFDFQLQKTQIEHLLRINNALIHQFLIWINQNGYDASQMQIVFPHFLFRQIQVIRANISLSLFQYQPTFTEQLLTLPKTQLIYLFSISKEANFSPLLRLYHKMTIRQIGYQTLNTVKCHTCYQFLNRTLLFGCQRKFCDQYFCHSCLVFNFGYQIEYLIANKMKNQQPFIKICPACKGSCPQGCQRCKIITIRSGIAKPNFNGQNCHFCNCSNQHIVQCSKNQCSSYICIKCLLKYQKYEISANNQDWICPSCTHTCFCNFCQSTRSSNNTYHISEPKLFQFTKPLFVNQDWHFPVQINKQDKQQFNQLHLLEANPEQQILFQKTKSTTAAKIVQFPPKQKAQAIKQKGYDDETSLARPSPCQPPPIAN